MYGTIHCIDTAQIWFAWQRVNAGHLCRARLAGLVCWPRLLATSAGHVCRPRLPAMLGSQAGHGAARDCEDARRASARLGISFRNRAIANGDFSRTAGRFTLQAAHKAARKRARQRQ